MGRDVIYPEWRDEQLKRLQLRFPNVSIKKLEEIIEKSYNQNLREDKMIISNNYKKKEVNLTTLKLLEFIQLKKPILSGNGMLFKNQREVANPINIVIEKFINSRKIYRKQSYAHHEDSYEFKTLDRMQLGEKVNINSLYGAFGSMAFFLYNIFTAAATTATGQALITTMINTYENFLGGSVKMNNLDDIYQLVSNVINDSKNIPTKNILENKTAEEVFVKITKFLTTDDTKTIAEIRRLLDNLTQHELNVLYYKNNIYDFTMLPKVKSLFISIFEKAKSFKDPNKVPEEIQSDMDKLWDLMEKYVFYNYHIFDRIQRGKTDTREVVVVTDTDSTMLNLGVWMDFAEENLVVGNKKLEKKNKRELEYIIINVMCTLLSRVSDSILRHYCESCNILPEMAHLLNAKNEFLFSIMILALTKKRYITRARLREGREFEKEKVDIKGHDFIKSSTTPQTRDYFTKIVEQHLLDIDNISPYMVLKKIIEFEEIIKDSLSKGEKDFLVPKSVKEFSAYKTDQLYKEQGVRALIAWTAVYPDTRIDLPAKFDMVKLDLDTIEKLDKLKYTEPEIYKALKSSIFESGNEKLASKGVQVFAIPRSLPSLPEWLIPYIDYDTMISDNVSRAMSILSIFGIEQVNTSRNKFISNIISI